jgi:glycosyltransferase involved in cell wall biosynthesis
VIVVDNSSTDNTEAVSKKEGAKVIKHDSSDYSEARNLGLSKAETDWILYIDADEIVSDRLAKDIQEAIQESQYSGFRIKRQNFYLGDNPWPKIESLERLFLRKKLKGWHGKIHESAKVEGKIGELDGILYHYTHRTIEEMVEKTLIWSKIEAELRYKSGHPEITWWRFPRVMLTAFWDSYVSQSGWKAGTVGVIESIYQSFSAYITYARLWELQQRKESRRDES